MAEGQGLERDAARQRAEERTQRVEVARVSSLLQDERTREATIRRWINGENHPTAFSAESEMADDAPSTQLAIRNRAQLSNFAREAENTQRQFMEAARAQEHIAQLEQEQAALEAQIARQTRSISRKQKMEATQEYASRQAKLEQLRQEQVERSEAALAEVEALNAEAQKLQTHLQEERALLQEQWAKTDPIIQAQVETQLAAGTSTERDVVVRQGTSTQRDAAVKEQTAIQQSLSGVVKAEQTWKVQQGAGVSPATDTRASEKVATEAAQKRRVELKTQTGVESRKDGSGIAGINNPNAYDRNGKQDPRKPKFEEPGVEAWGEILSRVKAAQAKWQKTVQENGGMGQGWEEQFRREVSQLTGRIQALAPLSAQLSAERDRVVAARSIRGQVEPDKARWEGDIAYASTGPFAPA